jgi:hypothetical protein
MEKEDRMQNMCGEVGLLCKDCFAVMVLYGKFSSSSLLSVANISSSACFPPKKTFSELEISNDEGVLNVK